MLAPDGATARHGDNYFGNTIRRNIWKHLTAEVISAEIKTKQKGPIIMFSFFTTQFYSEQQEQYREYCETDTLSYLHRIEMECDKRID